MFEKIQKTRTNKKQLHIPKKNTNALTLYIFRCCCCLPSPPCLLGGGESVSVALWGFTASHLAGLLRRRDPSTNPGSTTLCVSVGN